MRAASAKELRDEMLGIIDEQLSGNKPVGWDYTLRKLSTDDLRLVREFVNSFDTQDAPTIVPKDGMFLRRRHDGRLCKVVAVSKHLVLLQNTAVVAQYYEDIQAIRADYDEVIMMR